MAANRANVAQSLTIALITFVMLTFMLAVTTYLFYKKGADEYANAQAAAADASKSKTELQKTQDDRAKLLQILGFSADKSVTDIETETNETFQKKFGDFNADPKAYVKLSEWLLEATKAKDQANQTLQAEKKDLEEKTRAELADMRNRLQQMDDLLKKKDDDASGQKQEFDTNRATFETKVNELQGLRKKADDESKRLGALIAEIAKGEPLLSLDRQTRFKGQKAEGQVGILFEELRDRERTIASKNEVLNALRVATPELQKTVVNATPKDDRIDSFDGNIVGINEEDDTVLIDVGSTQGLLAGALFNVFDPFDPRPMLGDRKGIVEVVSIEGPAVARARVRKQSTRDPILSGDGISSSLWSPGQPLETVFVGYVQVDGDAQTDQDDLATLVTRGGGRVEKSVSPNTTLLVDGGIPRVVGNGERPVGWKATDEKDRDVQLAEARRLGIRVVSLNAFLEMMGRDRESFDTNRLRTPGARAATPAAR